MRLIKTKILKFSYVDTQIKGKHLKDKWESVIKRQDEFKKKFNSKHGSVEDQKKVAAVEAFRDYIRENQFAKIYLSAALNSIPQVVEQSAQKDFETTHSIKRPGVCYGYQCNQFLDALGFICLNPPRFQDAQLIGFPFYSLVVDLLNTYHGRLLFSIPQVNAYLKLIFDSYGQMLDSPLSLKHMNSEEGGWLSPAALQNVNYSDFICDPSALHYGYKSWHDWFTREIKEEARPFNKDENEIINSSESYPLAIPSTKVQWEDKFWLKDQKYSLREMLNAASFAERDQKDLRESFEGGTVYQGYLNPWCYHRWRSPVSGVIEKCYSAGYSYFVGNPSLSPSLDHSYFASQKFLSMISARQVYVIKADNPKIGRIAMIQIGMAEVSGIKNFIKEGQRINKGDLMGTFRYGGSSHVIIFDSNASKLRFNPSIYQRKLNPQTKKPQSILQKVRSPLAWVY